MHYYAAGKEMFYNPILQRYSVYCIVQNAIFYYLVKTSHK